MIYMSTNASFSLADYLLSFRVFWNYIVRKEGIPLQWPNVFVSVIR